MPRCFAVLLLTVCLPALAGPPPYPYQVPDWLTKQRALLKTKKVTLDFQGTPLKDVARFVAETTGIAIRLDVADDPAHKVHLRVVKLQVGSALKLITELKGLKVCHEKAGLVITADASKYPLPAAMKTIERIEGATAQANAAKRVDPDAGRRALMKKLEDKKVSLSFDGSPLTDVVQFLREVTGVNMIVTPAALKGDEPKKVTIDVRQESVASALTKMLKPLKLGYRVSSGMVFVDEGKTVRKMESKRRNRERALTKLRARRIDVELKGTALHALRTPLMTAAGAVLYIDRAAWERAEPLATSTRGKTVEQLAEALQAEGLALVVQPGALFLVTRRAESAEK